MSQEISHLSETESYPVTVAYDAFGRLESTTGPDNQTTSYTYDRLGRRIGVTDPSGQTSFEYDLWDNLVALTDAENQRTEFEYYPDDKLKLERRPMGEETIYEYDELGRLGKVTDATSQTTEYGYDAQSRIETIAYADGKTVTLSYDADGNLAGYSDGTTSATYTYDDVGKKLSETGNYGQFTKSFSYSYYGNGLKQTFTAPDSTVYTYNYGLNNELQEIQISGVGNITIPNYTWNRPATINYPGGTQRTYGYDALMRLQSLSVTDPSSNPLLNYQYSYDELGNILTKNTEHGNYTYGYDDSSRLLTADNPVLDDETYTYDDVGNRLTSANVSGSWSYNQNNELLGFADVEYEYDANGNLTQITVAGSVVWTYVYDAANRLVHVEDGTGTISADYYYDPFGRRLWKEVGGTKTYFFYSEEGLIAEYDASGTELRSYGYRPDSTWTTDPLWLKEGGTYYWYQNDHLGTPQKLVAQDGTVVWSAQHTAFGDAQIQVETVVNNLHFPGQYEDAETGLLYNYHRYYDPGIGRYLRVDPIGFEGGDVNFYEYVGNNSVNTFDALGLFWWVSRKGEAKASAIACNDTVEELAKKIGLDPDQFDEWLTSADGYPLPKRDTEGMNYRRFYIPNTVYAYWGGQLTGFGRWHVHWNESISYLQDLGFKVIEKRHTFNTLWYDTYYKAGWQWKRHTYMYKFWLDDELIGLARSKDLHGLYFWGHGDDQGLYAGDTTLQLPLFSRTEAVLNYGYTASQLPYKMALGLIFACFSDMGKPFLLSNTSGSLWKGWSWYLIPAGVGTYHVGRWIKPGDQETRHFQFQWPPEENMDWLDDKFWKN